ncbi:hypothetical protein WHR41_01137 [Cladosporium halotolerans]|uniref:Uncharacterized protein n=1 Tax=Cladosporium halotolerans TaxID=1052096 RepID=A0AB34KZ58_9PEZI
MAGGGLRKRTLTGRSTSSSPSPSPPTHSSYGPTPNNFDFPTLNNDGSVSDLIETRPPPGQRTPPAALSSLAVKMADDNLGSSPVNDLNDGQYDMVDDASDSNETVSIASTDNVASDDGDDVLTPDESSSIVDVEESLDMLDSPTDATLSASPVSRHLLMLEREHLRNLRRARQEQMAIQQEYEEEKERTLDSFLSEDLETPRQSMVGGLDPSSSAITVNEDATARKASTGKLTSMHNASPRSEGSAHVGRQGSPLISGLTSTRLQTLLALTLVALIAALSNYRPTSFDNSYRREALSDALVKLTGSSNATKAFNLDHLLPTPTVLPTTNVFGQPELGNLDVHFQGAPPNRIIVSLPKKAFSRAPQPLSFNVTKAQKEINFNHTMLIDGVYAFTLDPHEAHGIVTVSMPCMKPDLQVTVSHNFGRRLFQLQTYDKARTDISNTVTKDIAVARNRARSLTELLQSELHASIAATQNVTSQLAQQISHEAQAMASNAASALNKWHSASTATIATLQDEIAAVEEKLARAETQIDDFVADLAGRVKRSVMQPITVAQQRASKISAKYLGSDAAREKVCKRQAPSKDGSSIFFRSVPMSKKRHLKRFGLSGELVEKTTCGNCDAGKKSLGPKRQKAVLKDRAVLVKDPEEKR